MKMQQYEILNPSLSHLRIANKEIEDSYIPDFGRSYRKLVYRAHSVLTASTAYCTVHEYTGG